MGYGKKNTIKIDPLSYNIGLIGESGIGKTTIVKEMCEKLVGEDGYRFLECGKEDGADGINGINYLNCPEWSMDYDEETNSIIIKRKKREQKGQEIYLCANLSTNCETIGDLEYEIEKEKFFRKRKYRNTSNGKTIKTI